MKFVVLISSVIIQVCLGGLYAWSTFVPALREAHGLSTTQTQVVFGSLVAVFTVVMVFAGRLQEKWGSRLVAIIGGVLFGSGYLIAGFSNGYFPVLLLGIGLVAGAGTGFCYVCPLVTCIKWFPTHKGLVTGLAVAGFGGGAVLLSALAEGALARGINVLTIFRWIGLVYGLAILLSAALLSVPRRTSRATHQPMLMTAALLRDRYFWALCVGMLTGTFAGLLAIGNLKPIALAAGLAPASAAVAICAFAIGNASGRIAWGWLADRLKHKTITLSLAFLTLALAALIPAQRSSLAFAAASGLVGFGFGACFVVYASQVACRYGPDRLGSVYPMVFLAYGLSGLTGPAAGGWLFDATEKYSVALWAGVIVVGAGAWGTSMLLKKKTASPAWFPAM